MSVTRAKIEVTVEKGIAKTANGQPLDEKSGRLS